MISLDPAHVCSKFLSNRACSTYPPNQLKIGWHLNGNISGVYNWYLPKQALWAFFTRKIKQNVSKLLSIKVCLQSEKLPTWIPVFNECLNARVSWHIRTLKKYVQFSRLRTGEGEKENNRVLSPDQERKCGSEPVRMSALHWYAFCAIRPRPFAIPSVR